MRLQVMENFVYFDWNWFCVDNDFWSEDYEYDYEKEYKDYVEYKDYCYGK